MESIEIANRSTSSMASLATSGHAEMDGLIHGPNRICWPIIGAGITRFQKSIRIKPQLGGTLKRPTMLQPIVYQIWTTQTPSMRRWKIPHPCKFINWPRSFGTFSTLTGMEIEAFWNDWKIPKKIFPDIRSRSMDQKIWPTLLVIWQLQLKHWQIKHMRWLQ